jgi:hypothetical protein
MLSSPVVYCKAKPDAEKQEEKFIEKYFEFDNRREQKQKQNDVSNLQTTPGRQSSRSRRIDAKDPESEMAVK